MQPLATGHQAGRAYCLNQYSHQLQQEQSLEEKSQGAICKSPSNLQGWSLAGMSYMTAEEGNLQSTTQVYHARCQNNYSSLSTHFCNTNIDAK